MKAPNSCFCAGVNSSALAGAARQAAPASAAARPRAVISFIRFSRLRRSSFTGSRAFHRRRPIGATIATLLWLWSLFLADFRDRVFPRDRAEPGHLGVELQFDRAEERRVGKECRSRWSPYH